MWASQRGTLASPQFLGTSSGDRRAKVLNASTKSICWFKGSGPPRPTMSCRSAQSPGKRRRIASIASQPSIASICGVWHPASADVARASRFVLELAQWLYPGAFGCFASDAATCLPVPAQCGSICSCTHPWKCSSAQLTQTTSLCPTTAVNAANDGKMGEAIDACSPRSCERSTLKFLRLSWYRDVDLRVRMLASARSCAWPAIAKPWAKETALHTSRSERPKPGTPAIWQALAAGPAL
mmetsp:Transcript_13749/g.25161  ORF Transcript_13749/g.25161 Transcript_13749/m.25161 type:complete len:239 (+) Transcript_13749:962-1678(+)